MRVHPAADVRGPLVALGARLADRPAAQLFSREVWSECAAAGLTGLPVGRAFGGRSASLAETGAAFDTFARAGAPPGLVFALGAQLWAVTMVIDRLGSDAQRHRWLPALCSGTSRAGHAMTEAATGSDAFALSTTARTSGASVIIDGSKTFVTNGPEADVFVVFATVDRQATWGGLDAYLVERSTPGLSVESMRCMHPAAAPTAEVAFSDCVVPAANRLGAGAIGVGIFTYAMELERSLLARGQLGLVANRLSQMAGLGEAVERDRRAALWVEERVSRWLVQRAVDRLDARRKAPLESSLAKLSTSELWAATACAASDAAGAAAGMVSHGEDLADAAAGRIYSGTSEMQREILGRWLGLR
jgi:alkylation response protein AidB-like acyl-CoA dehydrogenase